MKAKEFIIELKKESKPRNFVAKNASLAGKAGQHKDKKKAEKQGDVKHKKEIATMESALSELSTEKLAQYKKAAGADASAADKAGDIKKADKRFGGIVKATNKQFANDKKGVAEESYGNHPSQRVDPRTGRKYVPPKSPLGQGVAEGERMKTASGMYRDQHTGVAYRGKTGQDGNDSYMTPDYLIQKYQERLAQIASGPYKRPKEVAQLKSRIAKLQGQQGVAEGKADYNFDIEDLKRLEQIRDLSTLKAQALALISKPSSKPMKPEKVEWFKNALERMNSPLKVIKLMYDLLLSGEGNAVVGTRSSMNPNSYRQRFSEQGIAEAIEDRTSYQVAKALSDRGIKYDPARESDLIKAIGMVMVKELNMSPREARAVMSDEDFLGDTMGELRHMEQGIAEDYNPEYDDEAGMADNNLETLRRAVDGIDDVINSGDNLPEWCQEKIAVAKSMLVSVWDYMRSEEEIADPEIQEMYEAMDQLAEEMAAKHGVDVDTVWEGFESMDDHVLYETAAWRRKEGKSKSGGLNAKGVASYRRENPGSKLQTAVTTKPSKLKKGSKAAKRRKSFCARMGGVKGPMKKPNGKPTRKALALRKWNC
jgi:hypothetical protein